MTAPLLLSHSIQRDWGRMEVFIQSSLQEDNLDSRATQPEYLNFIVQAPRLANPAAL